MKQNKLTILGFASGLAGVHLGCGDGPMVIQHSALLRQTHLADKLNWDMLHLPADFSVQPKNDVLQDIITALAKKAYHLSVARQPFAVLGGDHSCAIGTWSGVHAALRQQGDIGLIWVDAHMDSHTPQTTVTGRLHGMPLACLLGQGEDHFTQIMSSGAKIKPENVCLIGVRSYEAGEAALLERLRVKVYFMDEVKQRGLEVIWTEALARVKANTVGFGLSLDLDALDPRAAPGVDVPAANGIQPDELFSCVEQTLRDPQLIATELVEFDPTRDKKDATAKIVIRYLQMLIDNQIPPISGNLLKS